ncbi:MAG: hypothetical protein WC959_00970 [Kiritimatiellales bacterium]
MTGIYNGASDTTIRTGNDRNYGADTVLTFGAGFTVLLRFDLSPLNSAVPLAVKSVTLELVSRTPSMDNTPVSFRIHTLNPEHAGWRQGAGIGKAAAESGEVSFLYRSYKNEEWAQKSGFSSGDYSAEAVYEGTFNPSLAKTVIYLPPELISSWIENPRQNAGIVIISDGSAYGQVRSSEYKTVADRPRLNINYEQNSKKTGIDIAITGKACTTNGSDEEPVNIGNRREIFIDRFLIDNLDNLTMQLQTPRSEFVSGMPASGGYATVILADNIYHYYYRVRHKVLTGEAVYGYYYLRSFDGIQWETPDLGLFPEDNFAGNIILKPDDEAITHNFSPFLDTRPGIPEAERFKAVGGGGKSWCSGEGLYGLVSADGIRWKKIQEQPVIPESIAGEHPFDSQNVAFWSDLEQQYVCYYRTSWQAASRGWSVSKRGISRTTSTDFINWTPGVEIDVNIDEEQFYTNQTSPYFRASHIYIALPWRYWPAALGNVHRFPSDIPLMSSRGTETYDRTFPEALIRPGLHPERWHPTAPKAMAAALGVVPAGDEEMAVYVGNLRYVFRLDGFSSLHANMPYGEMKTKSLIFSGTELEINYSTSAAGRILVGIEGAGGTPVPGFSVYDCNVMIGDEISRKVLWQDNGNVGALQGQPVRLIFRMRDADLFSFRFL